MIASTNPDRVMSWFGSGKKKPINLAIATGRFSTVTNCFLTVVDGDLVNHPLLAKLIASTGTVTQRSGGGGDHAFFWSEFPIKNSCQLIDEKVDIRGSGGILVIAPSKHISGNEYSFTCDLTTATIQGIPKFLKSRLEASSRKKDSLISSEIMIPKLKTTPLRANTFWSQASVTELRTSILAGRIVPCGIRNTTMHRLLASDKAKGVASRTQLLALARKYLAFFERPDEFKVEIEGIVKSVGKYPSYNNSFEKVNQIYLAWLKKNGYKTDHDLQTLNQMDDLFFSSLISTQTLKHPLSLKEISAMRETFLRAQGLTRFATYKSQLLAKKLSSLNMEKKRTSKGNYWVISDPDVERTLSKKANKMEKMNMTVQAEDNKKKLQDGQIVTVNGHQARVELIKTQKKIPAHSREHLFKGNLGYDYNKSLLALLPRLDDAMMDLLENHQLVMDPVKTGAWLDQVKVDDVIGVMANRFKVLTLDLQGAEPGIMAVKVRPFSDERGVFVPLEEAEPEKILVGTMDHARELGLLEILWRENKIFGEPDLEDITLVLFHPLDEEPKTPSPQQEGKKKKKA